MNAWWVKYLPEILKEYLHGRQHLQKAVGNTGWLLFDRILRMGIGVIVSAWVARYLGPAQFGVLAYVISFLAFFQVIAGPEVSGFIVRDIAQERELPSVILGTAFCFRLIVGVIAWASAAGLVFLLHPKDEQLLLLTVIVGGTLVFQASDTVDLWFQSQSQSKRTVIAKLVAFLFSNGVKVLLLLYKAPLIAFAGVVCLECIAAAFGLAVAYRRFPTESRWRASLRQIRTQLHQSWPFVISGLLISVFMRIDQIMLKEILGEQVLGIYCAALPISQAWTVIPAILVTSLAPIMAQKRSQDEKLYEELLVKIFRFFAIIAISGAFVTAVASPWIIRILYGAAYESSALILSVQVFVNVFAFQGMALDLWIINNNVRTVTLAGTFAAAIIGIFSNVVLIKHIGPLGAVFSSMLAQCTAFVIIPCLFRRDLFDLYKRAFWGLKSSHTSISR